MEIVFGDNFFFLFFYKAETSMWPERRMTYGSAVSLSNIQTSRCSALSPGRALDRRQYVLQQCVCWP